MIPQTDHIILHRVDGRNLQVAVQLREIRRTLAEVPGVEQQDILLSLSRTDTVDISRPLDDTPLQSLGATADRLKMAVRIIEMENRQLRLLRLAGTQRQDSRQ